MTTPATPHSLAISTSATMQRAKANIRVEIRLDDRLDRRPVLRRDDRHARLDSVDARRGEPAGKGELVVGVEGDPGLLLAVAQRDVVKADGGRKRESRARVRKVVPGAGEEAARLLPGCVDIRVLLARPRAGAPPGSSWRRPDVHRSVGSEHDPAARDVQRVPGQPGGGVRDEKQRGERAVLGRPDASQRRHCGGARQRFVVHDRPHPVGADGRRRDAVDPDPRPPSSSARCRVSCTTPAFAAA